MTSPGQWYHDRARQRVVYWPRPGEDMRRVTVVAPIRAVLFLFGAPASDRRAALPCAD